MLYTTPIRVVLGGLLLLLANLPLLAQWQGTTLPFRDTSSLAKISISPTNNQVVWGMSQKYEPSATSLGQRYRDSLYFARTTDGGSTWQFGTIRNLGPLPSYSGIAAVDANTAWVAAVDDDFNSRVVRTTNGGATWTAQATTLYTADASWINGIYFWNAQEGIMMGDPAPAAGATGDFYEIYTTTNGGSTWTRVPKDSIPAPLAEEYGGAGVFSVRGNVVTFATISFETFSTARLFYSTNRGRSWKVANVPASLPPSFADAQYGIAADEVSTTRTDLRLTTNGGTTWTNLPPFPAALSSIAFIPGSRFLLAVHSTNAATGPFITSISRDLGQTWTEIGRSTTDHPTDVQFASATVGYAGGYQTAAARPKVYRYTGNPLSGLLEGKVLDARIVLAPNPIVSDLRVQVTQTEALPWTVILNNAQGQLIARQAHSAHEQVATFDLQALPAGLYNITIATEQGYAIRQVVKQ